VAHGSLGLRGRRGVRVALLGGVLAACGCFAGCGRDAREPPSIALILIDTLRADHLGSYGYSRDTTPHLDRLARDALVFDDAVAQSSWTLPSVTSLFSSHYPGQFPPARGDGPLGPKSLVRVLESAPGDAVVTLAEVLRDAGYRTVSVATNPFNADAVNLMQGFETRHFRMNASADWVVDRALREVDLSREGPFFLYLHLMDVHPPLRSALDPDAARLTQDVTRFGAPDALAGSAFREHRDELVARYDAQLREIDAQMGRLFAGLRDGGLFDRCVVLVTSDHGEEFWDHARLGASLRLPNRGAYGVGHGHTLFPELIEVPLILRAPGLASGRVATPVRLLDVAPTLLGLAGLPAGSLGGAGVDLLSATVGRDLPAVSETWSSGGAQKSLRRGRYQYLRIGARDQLFELDGFRPVDLPDVRGQMAADLDALLADLPAQPGDTVTVDEPLLEALRSLGYTD